MRPPGTSHASALPATRVAAASLPSHPGAMRVADVEAAPVHRPPVAGRGAARRLRSGVAPIALCLRGRPCPGRLGRCALAGCPGSPVPASSRARARAQRRRTESAVLPVDVLRKRDAQHPGDVGGGVPRVRAGNGESLVLLAPEEAKSSTSPVTALRQVGHRTWSRPRASRPKPARPVSPLAPSAQWVTYCLQHSGCIPCPHPPRDPNHVHPSPCPASSWHAAQVGKYLGSLRSGSAAGGGGGERRGGRRARRTGSIGVPCGSPVAVAGPLPGGRVVARVAERGAPGGPGHGARSGRASSPRAKGGARQ